MKLTWKKNMSSDYSIYDGGQKIGSLKKENFFSGKVIGNINGEEYVFYKKNIVDNSITFRKTKDSGPLGNINFNIWSNKANIRIDNQRYIWRYNNLLNNKWNIESSNGNKAEYKANFSSGDINYKDNDQLMILLGLYVSRYYQRQSIFIICILFVPIYMTFISRLLS
ncbi:hypothetical protein [Soonwooa sp.]|uniref:hypothetical protein n=1 Tax=Soonwooa sp. TaxID=1938592 RepID=UPI002605464D|nr:hypothetical protein [Soonwooa sp.]